MSHAKQALFLLGSPHGGVDRLLTLFYRLGLHVPGFTAQQENSGTLKKADSKCVCHSLNASGLRNDAATAEGDYMGGFVNEVSRINACFLVESGLDPQRVERVPARCFQGEAAVAALKSMKDLLAGEASGIYVYGDVALARIMPLWLQAARANGFTPKAIYLLRHPWAVAEARQKEQSDRCDLLSAHRLWLAHYRHAVNACHGLVHTFVSYERLVTAPAAALKEIGDALDLTFADDAVHRIALSPQIAVTAKSQAEQNALMSPIPELTVKDHCAPMLPVPTLCSPELSFPDQDRFDLFARLYYKKTAATSRLVWLSSYPRSGNTLLRVIMNHNFGFPSFSIYNDTQDIGAIPEVAEIVGHRHKDWSMIRRAVALMRPEDYARLDHLRYSPGPLKMIKTHSLYNRGFEADKVIYISRDGRAAYRSYASYQAGLSGNADSAAEGALQTKEKALLEELICSEGLAVEALDSWRNHFGSWSNHGPGWKEHPADRQLFLRFEDMVSNFDEAIAEISDFLGLKPLRRDVLSFGLLNAINADFFRKGKKKSWDDYFTRDLHALFWLLNYETMAELGYLSDQSPVCAVLWPALSSLEPSASETYLSASGPGGQNERGSAMRPAAQPETHQSPHPLIHSEMRSDRHPDNRSDRPSGTQLSYPLHGPKGAQTNFHPYGQNGAQPNLPAHAHLDELDALLCGCAEILSRNLSCYPPAHWGAVGEKINTLYPLFRDYFLRFQPADKAFSWRYKWEQLLLIDDATAKG